MYIAHKTDRGEIQTIAAHSHNTAALCREFAVEPWKNFMYLTGLYHDLGKYQASFQSRIQGNNIFAPHAFCGAQEVKKLYGSTAPSMIMQYVIAGHHAGIPDSGAVADCADISSLYGMLKRRGEDISAFQDEIAPLPFDAGVLQSYMGEGCRTVSEGAERFAFFTRYCFSCLTDADWLDTESFCTGAKRKSLSADFSECLKAVNTVLKSFKCETLLQKKRAEVQAQVFSHITDKGQVFLMNTPTGSGKTLASIKLALERAIALGKKRIIYVIPYNSIIDQTAKTFEKIFGSHATILRHQSSFDILSQSAEGQEPISLKQAAENWDAQIILTTAVQFFESIYSNKRSKLRKLHNMADSILIFDEAHLMPDSYLQPCLSAISHITKFLNSEAILLTATMPDYTHLFHDLSDLDADIVELVSNKGDFEIFNKCKINWLNTISDEFLLQHCYDAPSSLIIVNKRATAVEIYRAISVGRKFHLSTHMTALDRERTIEQIKCELRELELDYPRLENVPPERRITVVSTSLIEAGVDLDFFTVYRELWGLDSILQCAGRCNREGKRDTAQAYVFRREADSGKAISDAAEITKGLLSEFEDITLPACIEQYYQRLLWVRRDELRSHSLEVGSNPTRIPFKTYAEQFELISSNAVNVVVIQDERSRELVEKMRQTGHVSSRALQYYSFSVYSYELNMLMAQGAIETIEGIYVLSNNDYYTQEYGIRFEGHDYYI